MGKGIEPAHSKYANWFIILRHSLHQFLVALEYHFASTQTVLSSLNILDCELLVLCLSCHKILQLKGISRLIPKWSFEDIYFLYGSEIFKCFLNERFISKVIEFINVKVSSIKSNRDFAAIKSGIICKSLSSLLCSILACKTDECLVMGLPIVPFELDV